MMVARHLTKEVKENIKGQLSYSLVRDQLISSWCPPCEMPYRILFNKLLNPTKQVKEVTQGKKEVRDIILRMDRVIERNPEAGLTPSDTLKKKALLKRLPPQPTIAEHPQYVTRQKPNVRRILQNGTGRRSRDRGRKI